MNCAPLDGDYCFSSRAELRVSIVNTCLIPYVLGRPIALLSFYFERCARLRFLDGVREEGEGASKCDAVSSGRRSSLFGTYPLMTWAKLLGFFFLLYTLDSYKMHAVSILLHDSKYPFPQLIGKSYVNGTLLPPILLLLHSIVTS